MISYPKGTLEKEKERDISIEKEDRLEVFKDIKQRLAFINKRSEKTQEEFKNYITLLFDDEKCKYMTPVREIVSLCDNNLFDCNFRSKDNFKFHDKLKFECLREKTLNLKSLL